MSGICINQHKDNKTKDLAGKKRMHDIDSKWLTSPLIMRNFFTVIPKIGNLCGIYNIFYFWGIFLNSMISEFISKVQLIFPREFLTNDI